MEGLPGQLLEEPFRDFEYNRNHVLQSHGNRTLCAPSHRSPSLDLQPPQTRLTTQSVLHTQLMSQVASN